MSEDLQEQERNTFLATFALDNKLGYKKNSEASDLRRVLEL